MRKYKKPLFFRDLEYEISRFEKICAELSNLKQDWHSPEQQLVKVESKTIPKNKVRPKVPPKPKMSTVMKAFMNMEDMEESPGGTEV